MKNADMPAMPIELNGFDQYSPEAHMGLTKREMFAMHTMSAWIQYHGTQGDYGFSNEHAAVAAVASADALLRELES
ncbi:putative coil containing protein [Vibrio phage 142E35-1]|nr:putative coil containing protein [Vibrio phage 142E35-1]